MIRTKHDQQPAKKTVTFTFSVRYYCRLQAAFDNQIPERGFRGYVERPMELSSANTVVAVMHPANFGYPGGIEWSADSPYWDYVKTMARVPYQREIMDNYIAPLLEAARSIGIPVMYMISGWPAAEKYPQHQKISALVAEHEATLPHSPDRSWEQEFEREAFGVGYSAATQKVAKVLDIAPTIAPQPQDFVISTTAQATTLLRERGIWNILYTGFSIGGCVIWSEGGMLAMRGLGYRRILLRDCTMHGETAETAPTLELTRAAIRMVELGGLAYTADSRDVLKGIEVAKER